MYFYTRILMLKSELRLEVAHFFMLILNLSQTN